jgi:hypothetical protein
MMSPVNGCVDNEVREHWTWLETAWKIKLRIAECGVVVVVMHLNAL